MLIRNNAIALHWFIAYLINADCFFLPHAFLVNRSIMPISSKIPIYPLAHVFVRTLARPVQKCLLTMDFRYTGYKKSNEKVNIPFIPIY